MKQLNIHMEKLNLDTDLTLFTNELRMDHKLKCKVKNCKTPRIQHRVKIDAFGYGDDFFDTI